jgi:TetR/AcrR family acrAB operon transcriptional repressor
MRRTRQEAEETRRRILDAAVELFETRGFSATRIQDIADRTGLTRGAVYWHFKNKDELYLHIFRMFERNLDRLLEESGRLPRSPLERLRWLISRMVSSHDILVGFRQIRMAAMADFCRLQNSEMLKHHRAWIAEKYLHIAEGFIVQGKKAGEIRQDVEPRMAVMAIAMFVGGCVGAQLNRMSALEEKYTITDFVDFFIEGMQSREG